MKKAVIFDLTGRWRITIASIAWCGNRALARFGLPSFSEAEYKRFVGDGAAMLVRRALLAGGDEALSHFDEVYQAYREIFSRDCMYQVKPYDGIVPLLAELKKRGIRIAVLSNKRMRTAAAWWRSCSGRAFLTISRDRRRAFQESPTGPAYTRSWRPSACGRRIFCMWGTAAWTCGREGRGPLYRGCALGLQRPAELEENHADAVIGKPGELLSLLDLPRKTCRRRRSLLGRLHWKKRRAGDMIRLIASDIDGTLIEESTPDLYPEMEEEIRRLRPGACCSAPRAAGSFPSVRNVFRNVADQISISRKTGRIFIIGERI